MIVLTQGVIVTVSHIHNAIPLLLFSGLTLSLHKSLHNQGVLEQEKIVLVVMDDNEVVPASPMKDQLIRKDSASASMEV